MRAFPSGMRVRSDNLDPAVFWRKGVQIVALNWQRWDEGMMLNEGMFVGSKGYVLKPPGYRGNGEAGGKEGVREDAVKSQATAIEHKTLDLSIEVLVAQDIPLPLGDTKSDSFHPYVKIELHVEKPAERTGAPIEGEGRAKEGEYKWRTRTARRAGAGTGVDFGGEKVVWKGIEGVVEELGFIRYVSGISLGLVLHFAVVWGLFLAAFLREEGKWLPFMLCLIKGSYFTSLSSASPRCTSISPFRLTIPQIQDSRRQNRQRHPRSLVLHPSRPSAKRLPIRASTGWCWR